MERAMYYMGGTAHEELIEKDCCCRARGKFMESPKVGKITPHYCKLGLDSMQAAVGVEAVQSLVLQQREQKMGY